MKIERETKAKEEQEEEAEKREIFERNPFGERKRKHLFIYLFIYF